MFQIKFVDEIKTHLSRLITFFFSENRAIYEILNYLLTHSMEQSPS